MQNNDCFVYAAHLSLVLKAVEVLRPRNEEIPQYRFGLSPHNLYHHLHGSHFAHQKGCQTLLAPLRKEVSLPFSEDTSTCTWTYNNNSRRFLGNLPQTYTQ